VKLTNAERMARFRKRHPERVNASNRAYYKKTQPRQSEEMAERRLLNKIAAINVYTNGEGTCRMCGQGDVDVLCFDHISNDGAEWRKKFGQKSTWGGNNFIDWLRRNDYPDGIQVLCASCNMKKSVVNIREMRQRRNAINSGEGSTNPEVSVGAAQ
jgi:hypothetical protein